MEARRHLPEGGPGAMMGTKQRAFAPIVAVSLEALVPADHFYRQLQRTLDLSCVRALVQDTSAGNGRPSGDLPVFFRLHLVKFFEGIRSERLLMRHAAEYALSSLFRMFA